MKSFFANFRKKALLSLAVIFILTPILSIFFYPSYNGGTASGSAVWENKMTWGIYPFVFMGLERECSYNTGDREKWNEQNYSCSHHLTWTVFGIITGGETMG